MLPILKIEQLQQDQQRMQEQMIQLQSTLQQNNDLLRKEHEHDEENSVQMKSSPGNAKLGHSKADLLKRLSVLEELVALRRKGNQIQGASQELLRGSATLGDATPITESNSRVSDAKENHQVSRYKMHPSGLEILPPQSTAESFVMAGHPDPLNGPKQQEMLEVFQAVLGAIKN